MEEPEYLRHMREFLQKYFLKDGKLCPVQNIFSCSSSPGNNEGIFFIRFDLSCRDEAIIPSTILIKFHSGITNIKRQVLITQLFDEEKYGKRRIFRTGEMVFSAQEYNKIWNRSDLEVIFTWENNSYIFPLYI